jgi:hypothetical protein
MEHPSTLSICSNFSEADADAIRSAIQTGLGYISVTQTDVGVFVLLAIGTAILAQKTSERTWYRYDNKCDDHDTLELVERFFEKQEITDTKTNEHQPVLSFYDTCPLQVKKDFEEWYSTNRQDAHPLGAAETMFDHSPDTLIYCNIEVFVAWISWRSAWINYSAEAK